MYWLPPFEDRMKRIQAAIKAGSLTPRTPKEGSDFPSDEDESLPSKDSKKTSTTMVSSTFLMAFIASIFIVNAMIIVYTLENTIQSSENYRFRHNTRAVSDLVHDITEGAVRTLNYTRFMTEQGYLPITLTRNNTITMEHFLASTLEHANEASGIEILEFGFSDGIVEGAVYYAGSDGDEVIGIISNGKLTGDVYTIFDQALIGQNISTKNYYYKDQSFDLFDRPWYTSAQGKDTLAYNEPYIWYGATEYGVSWGQEIKVANTSQSYVIQSGLFLSTISAYLHDITLAITTGGIGDIIFIMSGDRVLLASSSGDTQQEVCGVKETINPGLASPGVNRTYAALISRFGDPQTWPKTITPYLTGGDSALGPMFVSMTTLEGVGNSVMDWKLVLSSPYSLHETSRGVEIVVILVTGIIILLTFVNSKLSKMTGGSKVPKQLKVEALSLTPITPPKSDDQLLKEFVQKEFGLHKESSLDPSTDKDTQAELDRALTYIALSTKKIDLWNFLRIQGRVEWQQKLFKIQRSKRWDTFILVVLCCHCAMAFGEAPCRNYIRNSDLNLAYQSKLLAGRAVCIIVEWVDSLGVLLYGGLYIQLVKKAQKGNTTYRLKKTLNIPLIVIMMILAFMFVDYIVAATTLYTTKGPSHRLYFFLPYSALLRPILIILRIPKIALAAKRFLTTTYHSMSTLTLLLMILLVAAITNVILFKGQINTAGLLQGRTFDNLISSLIQTTLFILTQSNIPVATSVVSCPLGPNGYYSNGCPEAAAYLYFTFISSIGYIIFLAVLIMSFQLVYFKLQRAEASRTRGTERHAYIAAFLVLENEKEKVSGLILKAFFEEVAKLFTCPIYVKIKDSESLNLDEFIDLMEQFEPYMEVRTRFFKHIPRRSHPRIVRLSKFFLTNCYTEGTQYCALVVGLTTFALYGLVDAHYSETLYAVHLILFFYFFLESILQIYVFGLVNFWFVPHNVFKESNNRYNLVIGILSVWTFMITVSLAKFGSTASRIILFLPMLRFFCAIPRIRMLFLAIIRILYKIYWLAIFGFLILYFYAICGIFLYGGAYQDFVQYNKSFSLFNFNSLADALWTLYACFVSSMITPVFLASIDTGEIFYSLIFFLSFLIFFRLVFMKILVAILCDAYRKIDSIMARAPDGIISTFEFWRYMKDEGRMEEGRWVTISVRTDASGASSFEIEFSNKGGKKSKNRSLKAVKALAGEPLDCPTLSKQAQWLSTCASDSYIDEMTEESRKEAIECLRRLQASAKSLEDKLCKEADGEN